MRHERTRRLGRLGSIAVAAGALACVVAAGLLWSMVQAASSGPNSPGTAVNDTGIGSAAWGSPGNATASDNNQASASIPLDAASNYLKATGFGFAIPSDAAIDGIQVEVERKDTNIGHNGYVVRDNAVRLVKAGVVGSTDRSSASDWPLSDTYASYGGSTDQWGESWTPADINGSGFGFAISAQAIRSGGPPNGSETVDIDHVRITVFYSVPAFDQSGFRWFANADSTDVGSPLAAQGNAASAPAQGTPFRLRMLLHVSQATLATSGQDFKLQFAGKGAGTCASPSGTPSSYTDVTGSTAIAYADNATPADGAALTGNANDPTHGSDTVRNQTYEEANTFTNSQASIASGEDGLWDFALVDSSAPGSTPYCFRVVRSDGTLLSSYVYPQITTAGAGGTVFDIVDSGGNSVASPSYAMNAKTVSFDCESATGTFGTSSQRLRVSNGGTAENWNLTLAATDGPTDFWDGTNADYDFNDSGGSPAGCGDGTDTDSLAGQLTVDPSAGTISPESGCTTTGISKGTSTAYVEGSADEVTVLSGTTSSDTNCFWDFTGIGLDQKVPSEQPSDTTSINLTLTLAVT